LSSSIATTSDNLFVAERFFANRIMLKQGYTSNVKTIDFWIETGAATGQRPWTGIDTYAVEGYGKGFGVREVIRTNIGLRP